MFLVAEGAGEDFAGFPEFCHRFAAGVVPGGHPVAAFMDNVPACRTGAASRGPGCPVDPAAVTEVSAPPAEEPAVTRIGSGPPLPDHGGAGTVPPTARTRSRPGPRG
jgi:hypothetical protein